MTSYEFCQVISNISLNIYALLFILAYTISLIKLSDKFFYFTVKIKPDLRTNRKINIKPLSLITYYQRTCK